MAQPKNRNDDRLDARFRRLWLATAISNLGDGLRLIALPLLATRLTSDPRLIAGVAVAERLPWLLLILPGGVLADRLDRRLLRVRLDFARAAIMAALATAVATGNASIPAIYAVAALLASAEAIVDSSSMALIPSLVDDRHLERAGSQLNVAETTANAFVGLMDGMSSIWNILTIALRQREIPDHLLGRVGASYRMIVYFGMPFGALLGGIATESLGVRWTIAVSGFVLVGLGLGVMAALPTRPATGR